VSQEGIFDVDEPADGPGPPPPDRTPATAPAPPTPAAPDPPAHPRPAGSPTWQSVVVAIGLVLVAMGLVLAALMREGVDASLKMYAALGPLVGAVTGALTTYFFTNETIRTERLHRARAEDRLQVMMGAADRETLDLARDLRPDLLGPPPP
jgi:hypothetical protein